MPSAITNGSPHSASPSKLNNAHTVTKFNNDQNKAEVLSTMHRKSIIVEHQTFMEFFHKYPEKVFSDIFKKITQTPANETETALYDTIVSSSTFYFYAPDNP